VPRHADGPRLWFRGDSPFIWARTTIAGKRWAEPTSVPKSGGLREQATREAAALYLDACRRRGQSAAISGAVLRNLDLTQLAAQFLAHEEEVYQGHDEHHVSRYMTDLKHYILRRWTRLDEVTQEAWLIARRELHRKNGGPLGSRSIAHLANTLRHLLKFCEERGILAAVPVIESPPTKDQRAEEGKRAALTDSGRERFLRALVQLNEQRAHRIYTALFFSLLRKGEAAALATSWVDWKKQTVTVPGAHSKSGEPEVIDLHPRVRRVLRAELNDNPREPDEPIFGRFDFHQANTPALRGGLFGRACLKAGLASLRKDGTVDFAGLTPHHLARHSSATSAADREGTTLVELMALARWRSPQMAARYLHPTVEAGRRASRRL
jgi:integrase